MDARQTVEAVEQAFKRYYTPQLRHQIAEEAIQRAHDTILADFQEIISREGNYPLDGCSLVRPWQDCTQTGLITEAGDGSGNTQTQGDDDPPQLAALAFRGVL